MSAQPQQPPTMEDTPEMSGVGHQDGTPGWRSKPTGWRHSQPRLAELRCPHGAGLQCRAFGMAPPGPTDRTLPATPSAFARSDASKAVIGCSALILGCLSPISGLGLGLSIKTGRGDDPRLLRFCSNMSKIREVRCTLAARPELTRQVALNEDTDSLRKHPLIS